MKYVCRHVYDGILTYYLTKAKLDNQELWLEWLNYMVMSQNLSLCAKEFII